MSHTSGASRRSLLVGAALATPVAGVLAATAPADAAFRHEIGRAHV